MARVRTFFDIGSGVAVWPEAETGESADSMFLPTPWQGANARTTFATVNVAWMKRSGIREN
ncbi:MAG: hypothetical protein A2150_02595 [Candidatus Muproteobacteria bacterium RBG_16_64_11]|uniref:Uncharacterized protein n=1 Tax=Candidatus Muproteobacteria bacterium RBG_16_64_11 TaxID=1817758 RepID=A0A1F6TF57_9PROT|nr:MAG: hypothetical protein A2150_02595 [Candidatus Muproteobacteria bacterium RBG_16_64_11]